jgi:hypothetical protein
MSAGVSSGGTQRRVQFGQPTVFSIPAFNTGRRVSPRPSSRAPPQAFSRVARRIPPAILQQVTLHFEAIFDATLPTLLPLLTGSHAPTPGFLIASFDEAYSHHRLQRPHLAIPPSSLPLVHRLEASLRRKLIARLASLATALYSLGSHQVSPPTDVTTHPTPSDGPPSPSATPASTTAPSTNSCSTLFFHWRLLFLAPLPSGYYRSIGSSKSGKKWLASLTYKIWHIPWAS